MRRDPEASDGLARYLNVDLGAARIESVWERVSEELEPARPSRVGQRPGWLWQGTLALGVSLAAVGVTLFVEHTVLSRDPVAQHSAFERAVLETAGDALTVDLQDGSQIELAANTRLELLEGADHRVLVGLRQGRVECDVTPRPGRRWAVFARGVEVRVTGTKFSVALPASAPAGPESQVDVAVERGSVEVVRRAERPTPQTSSTPPALDEPVVQRLHAGQSLSIQLHPAQATPRGTEAPEIPAPEDDEEPTPASSSAHPPYVPAIAEDRSVPLTAKELLDRGNAARRSGDVRHAASAYEEILTRHSADPRAGLAAFELGRLRMDRMNDMEGAVSALKRAVVLAPGAGFREDALARLVGAHSSMGATKSCQAAKKNYLAHYPRGVHAATVSQACGKP